MLFTIIFLSSLIFAYIGCAAVTSNLADRLMALGGFAVIGSILAYALMGG